MLNEQSLTACALGEIRHGKNITCYKWYTVLRDVDHFFVAVSVAAYLTVLFTACRYVMAVWCVLCVMRSEK